MIHLDTSALVAELTGPARLASDLRGVVRQGERVGVTALVLYEWWRGPRTERELRIRTALFPEETAVATRGSLAHPGRHSRFRFEDAG